MIDLTTTKKQKLTHKFVFNHFFQIIGLTFYTHHQPKFFTLPSNFSTTNIYILSVAENIFGKENSVAKRPSISKPEK